jgi:hypothetical protein
LTFRAIPKACADMLLRWKNNIVKEARQVDQEFIDVEKNETWERMKMHGIRLDQYAVKKNGSLEKLRPEIRAENGVIIIPMNIR